MYTGSFLLRHPPLSSQIQLRDIFKFGSVSFSSVDPKPNLTLDHATYIRWLLITCCARMKEKWVFLDKNIRFVTAPDVNKCLEQVE